MSEEENKAEETTEKTTAAEPRAPVRQTVFIPISALAFGHRRGTTLQERILRQRRRSRLGWR